MWHSQRALQLRCSTRSEAGFHKHKAGRSVRAIIWKWEQEKPLAGGRKRVGSVRALSVGA